MALLLRSQREHEKEHGGNLSQEEIDHDNSPSTSGQPLKRCSPAVVSGMELQCAGLSE